MNSILIGVAAAFIILLIGFRIMKGLLNRTNAILALDKKCLEDNQRVVLNNKRLRNQLEMAGFTSRESCLLLYEGWSNMSNILINHDYENLNMALSEVEHNKQIVRNCFTNWFNITPEQWRIIKRQNFFTDGNGNNIAVNNNGIN